MARGSIRQRSKVRKDSWTVQVYLGPDPVTGKKRYHSEAVRGSKAQAQRRLTELQRELDIGVFTRPSQMTVREYLEQWCRDYAETHVRRRTFEGYRGILDQYILPKLGAVALAKLTPRHVLEMESALLREGGEKDQGLSPQTVLHVHRVLSSALKNAVKLGMVARNVAGAVEPPRVTRQETRTLTWEEVYQLLEQVADPLYWTLILLDIQTGLRRSEILGLQWRDVDLPSGTLSVRRAWVKLPSGVMELTAPKSGHGRAVTLPPQSVEALSAHRERQWDALGNGDFVFCHSGGSPLNPDQVTKEFKRIAREAGMGDLRFHDLRHTHATLMLGAGVHLKVTSERMGHSSIAITGNLYSHVQSTVQKGRLSALEMRGAREWQTGG
jgi:integrase